MIKKKAKGKKSVKKAQQKRARKAANNELNPSELRKDIAAKVEAQAGDLADAVIEEGKKGQLATVKYLFEMAHIFPEALEESKPEEDESLAATLLHKLGVPEEPVIHDLYERGEDIVIPPREIVTKESDEKCVDGEGEKKEELVMAE
jgi:hypothetical protein